MEALPPKKWTGNRIYITDEQSGFFDCLVPRSPPTRFTMKDLVRDSFLGQAINSLSGGRLLGYADQKPDYKVPSRYLLSPALSQVTTITSTVEQKKAESKSSSHSATACPTPLPPAHIPNSEKESETEDFPDLVADRLRDIEKSGDGYLVDWDGPNDPDNPRCVSRHVVPAIRDINPRIPEIGPNSRKDSSRSVYRSSPFRVFTCQF